MQIHRQRSTSATEEAAISDYIASCVNFKSNITYTDIATLDPSIPLAPYILLIGTPDQLKDNFVRSLPFYCPAAAEAIARVEPEQSISLLIQPAQSKGGAFLALTVAAIPPAASRTNCPYRADIIGRVVSEVIAAAAGGKVGGNNCDKEYPKAEVKHLDVFVCAPAGAEVAVANAISRGAAHSFSCAKGASMRGFFASPTVHINVIHTSRVHFTGEAVGGRAVTVAELEVLCTSVQLCQRLVDAPTCILDTVVFAEIAQAYATELGAGVHLIKGEDLRERGYGGIYAVGCGAQYPPHLLTLHYTNDAADAAAKNVALVGKGIVYDCGGLAIKPATGMVNMKMDMAGAAAVFCGFLAVVRGMKTQPDHYHHVRHISVTLCLAENAISAASYRNGDVVFMKSGKSVEVINTDAEGRIVLGDGVYYASGEQGFVPDILMDMATLTGAQGIATGTKHAALYINDADVEQALLRAGRQCGDTCFPVLYSPEHHKPQFKSKLADMTNLMPTGTDGGVSCGGYFVESHLSEKFTGAFVHVDLAFPSFNDKGATGFGVNLIAEYLRSL